MKRVLIVGGANGIGLSIAKVLTAKDKTERVYIVDKAPLAVEYQEVKIYSYLFDLTDADYSIFDHFSDIDGLIITAGFGKLALFENIPEEMIISYFNVNAIATIRIIKHFYNRLQSNQDFYCGVMGSIAGFMTSPFLSVYAATKAALKVFIESVNVELEKADSPNRILNVSPGSIKGTCFNQGQTDLAAITPLAQEIVFHLEHKDDLFIPEYENLYKEVLDRYHEDFRKEGLHSYDYKLNSGRIK